MSPVIDVQTADFSFAEHATMLPLQAADMLAYRMRQVNEALFQAETSVKKKDLDRAMFPNPRNAILTYYGKKELEIAASRVRELKPDIERLGKISDDKLRMMGRLNQQ